MKLSVRRTKMHTEENQLKLLEEIQELGYNIVSCADCGQVFIHTDKVEYLICPHCKNEFEQADCPDLFNPGWDYEYTYKNSDIS